MVVVVARGVVVVVVTGDAAGVLRTNRTNRTIPTKGGNSKLPIAEAEAEEGM